MLASGLPSSRAVAHESRYRPGSSVASCAAAKVRAVFDDRILRAWPRSGAGATPTATSSPPSDRNCQVNGLNDVVDGSVSKALLDNKEVVGRIRKSDVEGKRGAGRVGHG